MVKKAASFVGIEIDVKPAVMLGEQWSMEEIGCHKCHCHCHVPAKPHSQKVQS
jgi:hypothetical protein